MKISLGSKIQDLERLVIENLKATELVEHPHIYHGDLRKKDEPISLAYKVAEAYRSAGEYFDPLIGIFPLGGILTKEYPGVIEIKTTCDEATQIRTIKLRLEYSPRLEVMEFKHDVLLRINQAIITYLIEIGKKPVKNSDDRKEPKKAKGKGK